MIPYHHSTWLMKPGAALVRRNLSLLASRAPSYSLRSPIWHLMNLGLTNTNSKMITFSFKRQKITNLQMQIQTRSNKCWYLSLTAYAPGKFSRFEGRNMLKPSAAVAINKSFICGCQWPSFKSFCPCKSEQTLNEPMPPQHPKPQKVLQLFLSSHRLTS